MADETKPTGREAVVRAAVELLGTADLTQVMGFLSYRAVARQAHVRPGTVEYHFASKRDLDLAAVREAVSYYGRLDHGPILAAVTALADGSGDLGGLAYAMGQELEAVSPSGPREGDVAGAGMGAALAIAASRNDPDARALMQHVLDEAVAGFGGLHAVAVEATGRAWRPGYDEQRFAQLTQALVTGFLYVRRYDADRAAIELFVDAWLRLFLDVTEDPDGDDPDQLDRFAARFGATTDDDAETRTALVEAAQRVHAERGWLGLTESAVADRAGVPRVQVVRLLGDRRGLAAAVWTSRLPRLERTLALLEETESLEVVLRAFLGELVGVAREDMALTAAFLEGLWSVTTRGGAQGTDPHSMVPITELLVPRVEQRIDQLADLDVGAEDAASLLVGYALYLAFTRASWPAEKVVGLVMDTTFRGMAGPAGD